MRLNRKKAARLAAFSTLLIVAVVASYLLLLRHPGLFFAYSFSHGGITLYSDEPILPLPAGRILEEVERRLAHSAHLLDRKGISVEDLLNTDFDQAQLEAEIRGTSG